MSQQNLQEYEKTPEFQGMLDDLANMGDNSWKMSEEDSLHQLQLELFAEMEDLPRYVKTMRHSTADVDNWSKGAVWWEEPLSNSARIAQREEFLASCLRLLVTPEWIADSKKRWEAGLFSSVTPDYLIMGDVYVVRRGDKLEVKMESDVVTDVSTLGRSDLTYAVWQKLLMSDTILAVRPKINGERFVRQGSSGKLVGFKTIIVPADFIPEVVEYYAGQYYIIYPYVKDPITYTVVENLGGELAKVEHTFLPHRFMSGREYSDRKKDWCSHKYDGLMIWDGLQEYRSKNFPSVELQLGETIWEVSYNREFHKIRPRPGKTPVAYGNALSRIRSCVPATALVTLLWSRGECKTPTPLGVPKKSYVGSKGFFFTATRKMVFIREQGKGLDEIGGRLEGQESPLDCLVREYLEETGMPLDTSKVLYLGISKDVTDQGEWTSHCFFGVVPDKVLERPHVEGYTFEDLEQFRRSAIGRPRQVWMDRHLRLARDFFSNFEQAWTFATFCFCLNSTGVKLILSARAYEFLAKNPVGLIAYYQDFLLTGEIGDYDKFSMFLHEKYRVNMSVTLITNLLSGLDKKRPRILTLQDVLMAEAKARARAITTGNVPVSQKRIDMLVEEERKKILMEKAQFSEPGPTTTSKYLAPPGLQNNLTTTIPEEVTHGSPPQLNSSLTSMVVMNTGLALPEKSKEIWQLLGRIFGDHDEIVAEDFHKTLRMLGYIGSRDRAIRWVNMLKHDHFIHAVPCNRPGGVMFRKGN